VLEVLLGHLAERHKIAAGRKVADFDRLEGDREGLLESLLHASLRLQEFEEERTNFWARAAHDLRAPLTAASGYCELLTETQMGPLNANQQELLNRMQHSLRKLNRMASAMFQLTAGRQLERKYELKRADIEGSIQRSIDEIEFFASEKNLLITSEITSPDQPLYVEPTQIEQVLVNILDNACKFTPRSGSIKVRGYPFHWSPPTANGGHGVDTTDQSPNSYRVDVCDSGPGIAPEHLRHIFDEYVSYGNMTDRSGGGLGLAICKMILRAHGGEIWAEPAGHGTTISFILPFNHAVAEEQFEPTTNYVG
jgi:signal transduction histidine kinase